MTTMTELYRSEDAQQILQLAIARQTEVGELSRDQLFEIAAELNIAPADIVAAEQEWLTRRGELEEQRSFDLLRRHKFQQRFVRYLIVCAFLILLNLLTGHTLSWSLYVVLSWGVGVALDAWRTFYLSGEEYEEAFQRWQQKRRLKKTVNNLLNRWLSAR
jgi:hypothetical protein